MAADFYYSELGLLIDVEKGKRLSLEEAKVAAFLDIARHLGTIAARMSEHQSATMTTRPERAHPKGAAKATAKKRPKVRPSRSAS